MFGKGKNRGVALPTYCLPGMVFRVICCLSSMVLAYLICTAFNIACTYNCGISMGLY